MRTLRETRGIVAGRAFAARQRQEQYRELLKRAPGSDEASIEERARLADDLLAAARAIDLSPEQAAEVERSYAIQRQGLEIVGEAERGLVELESLVSALKECHPNDEHKRGRLLRELDNLGRRVATQGARVRKVRRLERTAPPRRISDRFCNRGPRRPMRRAPRRPASRRVETDAGGADSDDGPPPGEDGDPPPDGHPALPARSKWSGESHRLVQTKGLSPRGTGCALSEAGVP